MNDGGPMFDRWLRKCESIAMSSEWCIDPAMPEWLYWYNEGFTPKQAIENLFTLVRKENP